MARRDVELVIRAKNEATKAVDSVTQALKELTGAQDEAGQSASRTDTLLGQLGQELRTLQAHIQGLSALGKIGTQLDRATSAVSRLEAEVTKTSADLAKLTAESEKAAQTTGRLRTQVTEAASAIERQRQATAAARAEQTAVNRAVREAETAQARLGRQIRATTEPTAELQRQYIAQLAALTQLRNRQREATANYAAQRAALRTATTGYRELQTQVRVAAAAERQLQGSVERAEASLRRTEQSLATARSELGEVSQLAGQASSALGGVAVAEDKIAAASERAATDLAKVTEALERQRRAGTTAVAPEGPAAQATAAYRAQVEAVNRAREAYRAAREEATRLGREMAQTAEPTQELRTAFLLSREASQAAKTEYHSQAAALNSLRGTANGSFAAFNQRVAELRARAQEASGETNTLAARIRQLFSSFLQLATASDQAGNAMGRARTQATGLRGALAGVYGESRQALSLLQRLRGEVLSLATAYLGLYGAIRQIGGVINAFRTLEAAQNRLGAAFQQDTAAVEGELDFLRQQANRLGISFEVLAEEYSQMVVAAQAANFTMEGTREIFLAVAEAGRVNKLSMEQMSGIFLALRQIIQKGKITAEELTRQLGDRLPGAAEAMAEAIFGSRQATDQLFDAMRDGLLVSEDILRGFGRGLNNLFGAQLPAALESATTAIGRFQNELFLAQLAVAEGGFIDALKEALEELNEFFQSREGQRFFQQLGQAAGKVTLALVELVKHFDLLIKAGLVFVGLKLAPVLSSIAQGFVRGTATLAATVTGLNRGTLAVQELTGAQRVFAATMVSTVAMIDRWRASLVAGAGATAAARAGVAALNGGLLILRTAVVTLTGLFRALWAAVGGVPGLVLTGLALLLGNWLTGVNDVNSALEQHEEIARRIRDRYDEIAEGTQDWAQEIDGITLRDAQLHLQDLGRELQKLRNEAFDISRSGVGLVFGIFGPREVDEQLADLQRIVDAQRAGQTLASDFRQALSDMAQTAHPSIRELIDRILEATEGLVDYEDAVRRAQLFVASFSRELTEAERAFLGWVTAVEASIEPTREAVDHTEAMREAVRNLMEMIPRFDNELRRADGLAKIAQQFAEAEINAGNFMRRLGDIRELIPLAMEALRNVVRETDPFGNLTFSNTGNLVDRIIQAESGGNPNARAQTSTAAGLGQFIESTWLGLFDRVFPQMAGLTDAAKLALRVGEENVDIQRRMLEELVRLNQQELVRAGIPATDLNTYLANFLGSAGAIRFLQAPLTDLAAEHVTQAALEANQSILGRGATVQDVLDEMLRRLGGGEPIQPGGLTASEQTAQRNLELQQQLREELEFQAQIALESERQQHILNELRRVGLDLTTEEGRALAEEIGRVWDLENAERLRNAQKEDAMARVNSLLTIERELEASIATLRARGDAESLAQAAQLETELAEVRNRLLEAVAAAQELAVALGDEEMVANLRNIALAAREATQEVTFLGLTTEQIGQLGNSFVSGLVGAFMRVAEAIAEARRGTTTWREALQNAGDAFRQFAADFLRQIAQMILQQAILNALQAAFGGPGAGPIARAFVGTLHRGGRAGAGMGPRRAVSPAWFQNAIRLHEGGLPGLRPGEIPAILKRGEEVLSNDDPRHILNGGNRAQVYLKNVFALDTGSLISEGLATRAGEQALLTYLRANRGKITNALGG